MNEIITLGLIFLAVLAVAIPSIAVASLPHSSGNSNANIVVYTSTSSSSNNNTVASPTVHSDIDSTPIAAVITISKGSQGNTIYDPQTTTINVGEEILIVNNSSSPHSVTNGNGPNDPLAEKLSNTGIIQPRGFTEYVASNLQPGKYPYYSTSDPSVRGEIIIVTSNNQQ
jgi:plastocyanin